MIPASRRPKGSCLKLQAAGIRFRVADIPRQLRGGCGLCIYMDCAADEETPWVLPIHLPLLISD
ncbi:DUF3343 domain-containing protein [Salmonella enterica subsp. enterica serovar Saintpaul]|nr:DUF3343 domain-containing protein [Salmonella enterica subsp. enterica serovar Saintpaul]